jgi:mevalonate kinase
VLKHLGFDSKKRGIKIHLGGDLCAVSGIGASAANCVSLARALAAALGKSLTEEEVNTAAYEGEKGYHGKTDVHIGRRVTRCLSRGTPSGVDNTASTYGGLLRFQRSANGPLFEPRKLSRPCRVVYASTGITASTTAVVGDVRARRESDRAAYDALEARYDAIFTAADAAFASGDNGRLGTLADENHALLQTLGVSCAELDALVLAARAAGAVGAKMSGTGRGGLMFAICLDDASQQTVYDALVKLAPQGQVWKTYFQ